jgi:hypothetical protein
MDPRAFPLDRFALFHAKRAHRQACGWVVPAGPLIRGVLCLATFALVLLAHPALAQVTNASAATREPASLEAPAGRLSVDLRDVHQWALGDQVSSALDPPPAAPLEIAPAPEIEPRSALMWKRSWFAPPSIAIKWLGSPISAIPNSVITAAEVILLLVLFLIVTYTVRHFFFTLNRLFGEQRHPYLDIDTAQWPSVTVLIPAHNEEAVIGNSISALLQVDYPADRLTLMPVNDRSTDGTRKLIDDLALANPALIDPYHRTDGAPGKAAALKDASNRVKSDIIIVLMRTICPDAGSSSNWSRHFLIRRQVR